MAGVTTEQMRELRKQVMEAEREKLHWEARIARAKAADYEHRLDLLKASEMEHRVYHFNTQVSSGSVDMAIGELGVWVRRDPSRPITIIFDSPGGSVFDGLALYDTLQAYRANGTQIDTHSVGMAASMGGILLQAGETRTMGKHAYMLIHEVSSGAMGNISELKDKVKFSERLQERCLDILADRSKLSKRQIKNRWERKDWWLDADEALEHGFIDAIQ